MKKLKEAVWFVVPLVGLTVAFWAYLYAHTPSGSFGGQAFYFKSLLTDMFFLIPLAARLVLPMVISFGLYTAVTVVFWLLRKKPWVTRKTYYAVMCGSALLGAVVCILCSPMIFDTVLDSILALQATVVVLFGFWMVESITQAVHKKKAKEEVTE